VTYKSDYLVIGSGAAGLSFSLRAASKGKVTVITKKKRADSNTNYAQGGIASVFDSNDTFESHIEDTLKGGVGLCFKEAVELIVRQGPERITDLEKWGVSFTYDENKKQLDLGREGGHTKNRIVHALDKTGMAVEEALLERVKNHKNITVLENQSAIELITEHHLVSRGKNREDKINCWGVYALDGENGEVNVFLAKVTVLATGGAGQVYLHTSNPDIATGDGVAMAFRAGAAIANMEFMQFHPTTLYHPGGDSFLVSEAVRGHGGILRNSEGQTFMEKYDERGGLAPRDVVARAIDTEIKSRGDNCVYLDVTHIDASEMQHRFPQINERLLSLKIDMTKEWIPVVPAAHYTCGGVLTDLNGRTVLRGLYAVGEVACTGVHGANRLASNSLLEALVFSERAHRDAEAYIDSMTINIPDIQAWNDDGTFDQEEWVLISHDRKEIQRLMWDYVGIVRSDERLERNLERIELIVRQIEAYYKKTRVTPPLLELRNIACNAALMTRSALFRKESRGLHYTTDYLSRNDDGWLGSTVINKDEIFLLSFSADLLEKIAADKRPG